MRNSPALSPSFKTFLSFLLGILAADRLAAGDLILSVLAVEGLSAAVMKVRWRRMGRGNSAGMEGLLVPPLLFLVVFSAGAMRLSFSRDTRWAFFPGRGTEVHAIVTISEMVRRDPFEVSGVARISGGAGVDAANVGCMIVLRCFPGGDSGQGCSDVMAGAVLAVSGRAVRLPDGRSAVLASGSSGILPVEPARESAVRSGMVDAVRVWLTARAHSSLNGASRWLVPAIVLGEGRGVPAVDRRAMAALGTAHVLSVSGLHVVAASAFCGLVVGLIAGIPSALGRQRVNVARAAALASVCGAWLVSLVAGSPPPATRAAGMATALVLSRFMVRRVPPESVLSVTGMADLMLAPENALSISFHLSYAAVFGIMLSMRVLPRFRPMPGGRGPVAGAFSRILRALVGSLTVSAGASLATMPLTVHYFGSAPLVSPLANLLIVPVFTFFVFPGAVASLVLVSAFPACVPGAGPCGVVVDLWGRGLDLIMSIQSRMAGLLPDVFVSPWFPLDAMVASGSVLALLLMVPGRKTTRIAMAVFSAAAILFTGNWSPEPPPGVWFLDAGKGDAALIRCPSGDKWLVDTGPPPRGSDRLIQALARARVNRITGVVVTHAHDDHYGGLPALIAAYAPFELVASRRTIDGLGDLPSSLIGRGGRLREVAAGDTLLPGCGFDSPVFRAGGAEGISENNASLVFRLGPEGEGVLFMGDLEMDGETELMATGTDISAGILKVGHHGSSGAGSKEFLSAATPRVAVITGWPSGPRAGPGGVILARFLESNSAVMSTVVLGDVIVETDPRGRGKIAAEPVFKPRNTFPRIGHDIEGLTTELIQSIKSGHEPRQYW